MKLIKKIIMFPVVFIITIFAMHKVMKEIYSHSYELEQEMKQLWGIIIIGSVFFAVIFMIFLKYKGVV